MIRFNETRNNQKTKCGSCKGSGNCFRCGGTGKDPDYEWGIKADPDCRRCNGTGVCVGCKGSGYIGNTTL
jgi:hypothetical protein